ncbi:MAG: transcriptional regulator NrdR [Candidatus Ratteibacteria bacterium]|nr:transcriptional regulator NrdR [Candidatus Ratteibacteria bacterium]
MKCPYCANVENKVIDSRLSGNSLSIRRRRECLKCSRRFTTYERIETVPFMVIKKDGRREPFQREKLLSGLLKACEKRPVSTADIENLVEDIEREVKEKFYDEVSSDKIGEVVMRSLRKMDDIAYVRFASVYRQFTDVDDFLKEVKRFSHTRRKEG